MRIHDLLKPRDAAEAERDAVEDLVFSIQICLQNAMSERGVSQKDLADKLGLSPARVSQILSDQSANLTLRTIGRIAHALGEEFELVPKKSVKAKTKPQDELDPKAVLGRGHVTWFDETANDNVYPFMMAA
jgi:transcriptional regulator with XRE-family HTH domain